MFTESKAVNEETVKIRQQFKLDSNTDCNSGIRGWDISLKMWDSLNVVAIKFIILTGKC